MYYITQLQESILDFWQLLNVTTRVFIRERERGATGESSMGTEARYYATSLEGGGRGHQPPDARTTAPDARKGQRQPLPSSLQGGTASP